MNTNQGQQAQLDIQRMVILYKHAHFTITGIIIATTLVGYVIYQQALYTELFIWLASTLSTVPIRLALISLFSKEKKNNRITSTKALTFENCWIATSLLTALAFSFSFFYLPDHQDSIITYLFIGLVLVAMITGSIVACITSIKVVMTFLNITIISFIARCFMEADPYFSALGTFFIAFYLMFISLSLQMHSTVISAVKQHINGKEMAYRDSLTGLWNRRKLYEVIGEFSESPYSLLVIDVDHFKQINDEKGHAAGDNMLIQISLSILSAIKNEGLVIRYGGEEFLVLLPNYTLDQADELANTINQTVEQNCNCTVSIGVVDSQISTDFDIVVETADKMMYQAKAEGRNRTKSVRESLS